MRDRRNVLDSGDFQTNRLQGADGGFATRTRAFHTDFDFAHTVSHSLPGRVLRHLLRRVRRALARSFERYPSGTRPTQQIPVEVGDAYLRVIERGQNMSDD